MRKTSVALLMSCVGLGVFGCKGRAEFGGGSPGGSDGGASSVLSTLKCDAAAVPAEVPLRRLSAVQYENTLRAVLEETAPTLAPEVMTVAASAIARYPPDERRPMPNEVHGGYREMDQVVQDGHVRAAWDVAVAVAAQLTSTTARRTQVFGACATDADTANDVACLRAFIADFGARVQRHPLTDADVDFYAQAVGNRVSAEDLSDLVTLLLVSPRFLYHVEGGDPATESPTRALDAHELAARLSYHFWQAPPDAALLEAARTGDLLTEEGYAEQVTRLFESPRTAAAIDAFFHQYLWLDEVPQMDLRVGDPYFDAVARPLVPSATLHHEMVEDVMEATRQTRRAGGTLSDLFYDRNAYAKSEGLAAIYGTPVWSGEGAAPVPPDVRAGLITRPAFLASASGNTRPIMKGVFVRQALLCDGVPPPPAGASMMPIDVNVPGTTRQKVEALTEQQGTSCASCHTAMINPIGFATEDFDALGRHRTVQLFFDSAGNPTGQGPIDTRSVPRVLLSDATGSEGAKDLTKLLVDSGRVQLCFARQYFRFTFARGEDTRSHTDDCVIRSLTEATLEGRSLSEVLQSIAHRPEFKRKNFQ